MYLISTVSIDGFWDSYNFTVHIDKSVTFFIGQNGTGKTTLINLLAAALTADFRTLDRMPFKKITINLEPKIEGERPSITVQKSSRKDKPFEQIEYRITPKGRNQKEQRFSLDDFEEQLYLRRSQSEYYRRAQSGLLPALSELVSVNWLSVNRAPSIERPREERTFESSIDQKLEALSNDIVRFLSTLSKQKDDEIRAFQEHIFVSLIEQRADIDVFDESQLGLANAYADSLRTIFKELHVHRDTSSLIGSFIERASQAIERHKVTPNSKGFPLSDLYYRLDLYRIGEIVKRWEELQGRLNSIFSQRDKFQKIADDLFQRKELYVSETNEILFRSRSGKTLRPQQLSSGEKQLLILMCETLLQRETPTIFIADEPELSLHVLWQERIVASLRALNPNAQIIFATHSPDIVGPLADKAIDMESVIK